MTLSDRSGKVNAEKPKKQNAENHPKNADFDGFKAVFYCAPGKNRTSGTRFRKPRAHHSGDVLPQRLTASHKPAGDHSGTAGTKPPHGASEVRSMMYDVQLLGNMHHGGRPGYRQEVRAMLGDEHMGSQFATVVTGEGPCTCNHLVLSRRVNADTASEAMRKFRQWQEEGLPDSFLNSLPT